MGTQDLHDTPNDCALGFEYGDPRRLDDSCLSWLRCVVGLSSSLGKSSWGVCAACPKAARLMPAYFGSEEWKLPAVKEKT